MIVSKNQVVAALAELRVNRPRHAADRHIRTMLRMFGNGANSIGELSPDFYFHVFCAAGGAGHVCAPVTTPRECMINTTPARIRTPLVAELEAKLATALAKTRRSVPGGRVDIGAPAQFGDEDAAREYPNDGRKMQ